MQVTTTRFGEIHCPDDKIVRFPTGIIGFPKSVQYAVLDHTREVPFKWLQSLDEGHLAFVIMDPAVFKTDYQVIVEPDALAEIEGQPSDALICCVILTVPSADPASVTANLRAPIVVNERTRLGKQLILPDELPTRFPVFARPPGPRPVAASLTLTVCTP